MKKYFVHFTYTKTNSEGDPTSVDLYTFEILDIDPTYLSRDKIKGALLEKGYKNVVDVLHMSPL